jgi:hypothetical protein
MHLSLVSVDLPPNNFPSLRNIMFCCADTISTRVAKITHGAERTARFGDTCWHGNGEIFCIKWVEGDEFSWQNEKRCPQDFPSHMAFPLYCSSPFTPVPVPETLNLLPVPRRKTPGHGSRPTGRGSEGNQVMLNHACDYTSYMMGLLGYFQVVCSFIVP